VATLVFGGRSSSLWDSSELRYTDVASSKDEGGFR
jgi:hypothetical protein